MASNGIPRRADGAPLTIADLPAADARWTKVTKANVLAAIECGLISLPDVCERYALSEEELLGWRRVHAEYGANGLSVTELVRLRTRA